MDRPKRRRNDEQPSSRWTLNENIRQALASVHGDGPHQSNDLQQQPDVFGTDEYQVAPQDSHNIPRLQQDEYVSSDTDEDMFPGDNVNRQFLDDSIASDGDDQTTPDDSNGAVDEDDTEADVFHRDIFSVISSSSSLAVKVATIAIFFNLPNTAINAFLALLRFLGHEVPRDARTIKKTQRNMPDSDDFHHFGLEKQLRNRLEKEDLSKIQGKTLKLQINIDGIPLFRSSKTTFWPILCLISNSSNRLPFIVSIYCGPSHPPCLDSYLKPFVDEMRVLGSRGMILNNVHFKIVLDAVICDAPARSYVKRTQFHTGKYACERCNIIGISLGGMTFPIPGPRCSERTNETFRAQRHTDHHDGRSPFVDLLSLDMVQDFPLDYMHLVCLGAMRRLLRIWVCGKKRNLRNKLSDEKLELMNSRILKCINFFPNEFARKGRGIEEVSRWKAVEYRSFLLYSGPVVMKDILPEDKYAHFILLHAAMCILLNPSSTVPQVKCAGTCLLEFVKFIPSLYGEHNVTYNMHNLIHLANDCLYFNVPLDEISSFPFENYLGKLKHLLRNTRKPLAQLVRRLTEIDNNAVMEQLGRRFHKSQLEKLVESIKPDSKSDSFCFLRSGKLIKIMKMGRDSFVGSTFITKQYENRLSEFYNKPVQATHLKIHICTELEVRRKKYAIDDLKDAIKCVAMPIFEVDGMTVINYLLMPLLHVM